MSRRARSGPPILMPALGKRQTLAVPAIAAALLFAAACTHPVPVERPSPAVHAVPPVPVQTVGSVAPGEPPHIWVAGTLTDVTDSHIDVREGSGQTVEMQRLAAGTTSFYRIDGDHWARLSPQAQVSAGQAACTEALLDGTNVLALRVFLGAGCGPA
jgi:hypothetical protein